MPRGGGSFTGPFRLMLLGPLKAADVCQLPLCRKWPRLFLCLQIFSKTAVTLHEAHLLMRYLWLPKVRCVFCSTCVRTLF